MKGTQWYGLLAGFLCFIPSLAAQQFTGRVTDKTGALIPRITITARNTDTNTAIRTTTTTSGVYTIPYLIPGKYLVVAEGDGFEKSVRTGIVLQVGETATVNFVMRIGSATESVTVNGDELLDRDKADMGEVVENTRVTELPLNGRDPNMLSILNAGVVWTGYIGWQRPFDDTQMNLSVNGGWSGWNELMLDGISNEASAVNNTGNSKIAYVAPVDSVQEFKIVTNPYDAQYGRSGGGVVDMRLKSGTNKLHGDVYEFARRTWLDANTWQNNWLIAQAKGTPDYESVKKAYSREDHKLDQYGAEVDGPVRIPKFYNGKDKTFFLLQYENWNEIVPQTSITSVPDPNWAKGDFSNLTWWNGAHGTYEPIWIYDPNSLSCTSSGVCTRQTFAAEAGHPNDPKYNVIPNGLLNAVSQKIMSYFPKPNTTPAAGTNPFSNNYSARIPRTDKYRNVLGKIDENLTANDRFSLRYGYWERVEVNNSNGMPGVIAEGFPYGERSHTFAVEETHTFNPNLIFNFRAVAVARADYNDGGPSGFDPTSLGLSKSLVSQLGASGGSLFPQVEASEFAKIGSVGNTQTISNSLSLLPSITWVKGPHTIHAGLDLRYMQSGADVVNGGLYSYVDRQWTQNHWDYWDSASGNSFSSFVLGYATNGSATVNTSTLWSQHYWAPFIQDDWKVSKRLTLNLGLRYDINPSMVERNNHGDYAFDTKAVNPIDSEVDHSLLPNSEQVLGGITFLGVNGHPRQPYSLTKTNIQPRVGFAYSLNQNTVFRGGFGEMILNPAAGPNSLGYNYTTTFNASLDGGKHPYATIDNPYPNGITPPPGSSNGLRTALGQSPWFLNPNYKTPSVWTFSLGLERSFLKHDTINVSYVGTRTYNLDSSDNINRRPIPELKKCNLDAGGDPNICSRDYPTNPFKGIKGFEGSSWYTAPTIQHLQLLRPYPEFGAITEYQLNDLKLWYNSLQVTAVHKWSDSLTLHGTWTWSKLMDGGGYHDTNYRVLSRVLDSSDRTHRITISGVYLLPVGRGRKYLGTSNRIVDAALGGWEYGGLFIYETGAPWTISSNYLHNAHLNRYTEKTTGYIRGVEPCFEHWNQENGVWKDVPFSYQYDGSCQQMDFQSVPSYGMSTNTVYTGIRIPSNYQFDSNISKNFAIKDDVKLQLRLESFNVLNHPLWQSNYSTDPSDVNFGTIERGPWGQSNLPRETQIAIKLMW